MFYFVYWINLNRLTRIDGIPIIYHFHDWLIILTWLQVQGQIQECTEQNKPIIGSVR